MYVNYGLTMLTRVVLGFPFRATLGRFQTEAHQSFFKAFTKLTKLLLITRVLIG
jgi:hypothetical protein